MKLNGKWIISLSIIWAMLFGLVPSYAWQQVGETLEIQGEEAAQSADSSLFMPETVNEQFDEGLVLVEGEVVEEREISSKRFHLSGGLSLAVCYPYAVHFPQEEALLEIDNTLQLQEDGRLHNRCSDVRMSFPKELTESTPITVEKDGYTLSFSYEKVQTAEAEVENPAVKQSLEELMKGDDLSEKEARKVFNQQSLEAPAASSLTYRSAFKEADLQYELLGNTLKESIVLQSEEAALGEYRMHITAEGLTAALHEDGSLEFWKKGEAIFTVPAPVVFDSNGQEGVVRTEQEEVSDGEWCLTYRIDPAWLFSQELFYPLLLDPTIYPGSGSGTVTAVNIRSAEPGAGACITSTGATLNQGYTARDGIRRSYLKIDSLPALKLSDHIVNATLQMGGLGESSCKVYAYEVLTDQEVDYATITWNQQPATDPAMLDYDTADEDDEFLQGFDITKAVSKWYAGGYNNGILLKGSHESSYASSLSFNRTSKLKLFYINANGLEDHWSYTDVPMGRAGTAYVQHLTGNLTLVRNDLSCGGEILPAEATFVYNLSEKDTDLGFGKGFRSIYSQTIKQKTVTNGSNEEIWYIWTDGDGTERYFRYTEDPDTDEYTISSENRDGYTLTIGSAAGNRYSIKDKKGNYLRFDRYGRLFKIQEKLGYNTYHEILIEYTAAAAGQTRILRVTDGAGRIYEYNYSNQTTGRLSSVRFLDTEGDSVETVSYAYDSGRLTQVTYADGSSIRYTWNGNQITGICGVEDSQGAQEHLFIGYPDGASSGQQKVSALTYCSGGAEVSGLDFAYGPSWCILTDHADTESGIPRQTTYRFNPYGNTVAAANSAGQWASAAYEKDADSEAPANRLSAATRLQESLTGLSPILLQTEDEQLDLQNAENLVNNGDFEETPGAEWVRKSLSSSDKVVTSAGNRGRCALKAFKLTGTSGATRGLVQTLAISGDADDTITFGGWFLYQGPVIKDSRRAGLKVQLYYNSTSRGIVYVNVDPSDGGWQYISGSIVPTGGTRKFNKVVITLVNSAAGSTLLCDGIQMEERECNYRYTYNDEGDITSVKSPTGKTTTYSYSSGNLTCIDPPGSGAFHFTYSYNRLTKITTPTGIETTYTNDSNGNRLEKTVRPSSRSLALTEEYTYSDSGNMKESITTADRSTISYVNDEDALRVNAVIDPMGSRTEYTYDAMGRVIKTAQQGVSVETVYDGDRMTGLCRGSEAASMEYGFSYGPGGLESVRAAGRTLTENEYSDDTLTLSSSTYGNGDQVFFVYDELTDELLEKTVLSQNGEQKKYQYFYNAQGQLCRVIENGLELSDDTQVWTPQRSENYLYNEEGQIERSIQTVITSGRATETVLYDSSISYSANGKVTSLTETIGRGNDAVTTEYQYTYDLDGRPSAAGYGAISESLTYDNYGRLSEKTVCSGNTTQIGQQYTYRTVGTEYTTPQVSALASTFSGSTLTHSYTYDANGNILSDTTQAGEVLYEYDSFGQMIREKNGILSKAWAYTYDSGGNILSKTERSYSGGNIGAVVSTHTYGYDDETWPDLLTEYDGDTITYDEVGNPETFLGWNMTWKGGRQLACMAQGEDEIVFDYNESGLRTSKVVNDQKTEYIWSGDRLVAELAPSHSFCFHYDAAGEMIGYTYRPAGGNASECLLVKNLQGDVERVISDTGSLLASYTYDAWGNLCQSSGSLAAINPIRYRSYYFDSETGLYYLQSRYYSPQVGRFVNADGLIDTDAGFTGCNLYAYAANSPVIAIDSAGNSAVVIVCAVVGACAGGYTGYRIAEANGYTGWKKAGAIAGGAGIGAAICGVGSFYTEKYVSSIAFASGKLVSPNFDYEKIENHLFNKKHNLDALFRTGDTNATVMKRIMDMALNCSNQWVEGSNDLRTTIDGMDVTIRFYVQNGQLQNLNCFRGISERSINNLIVK